MNFKDITKAYIFDFDGTLIDTPLPESGKKIWQDKTGEVFPHKGWWSKPESLDIEIFELKPYDDIVSAYNSAKSDPHGFVSLCTGRIIPLFNHVISVLEKNNLRFDDVVLTGDKRFKGNSNDTLSFKINYLGSLQKQFPNLKEIEMWDDRAEHHSTFVQWSRIQPIPVKINLVHQ